MIVCHSRKFIFFSFPKTGSESVRDMFAEHNEEDVRQFRDVTSHDPFYSHMPPIEAKAVFDDRGLDFEAYFKFTVTRNPFPRMVSNYSMVMAVDGVEKLKRRLFIPQKSFPAWLEKTQTSGTGGGGRQHQKWRQFGTWSTRSWITGQDGVRLVDHVLRLEHLSDELPPIFEQVGIPQPQAITHKNRRVKKDWRSYYNDQARATVQKRYADDLSTYGYTFH